MKSEKKEFRKEQGPEDMPTAADWVAAEAENPHWDSMSNRAKKRLARDQMYHRQYHSLCDAIMGFRGNRNE